MKVSYAVVVKWHWLSKAEQIHSVPKGINGRIIIKCTLKRRNGRMRTGFICLKIWTSGKLLLTWQWTIAFTKWEAFFDQSSNYDRSNKDCYLQLVVMSQFRDGRLRMTDDSTGIMNLPRPEQPPAHYSLPLLRSYCCWRSKRDLAIHINWSNYVLSMKPKLDWSSFNGESLHSDLSCSSLFLC